MSTQRVWADIADYISEFDRREGADPNPSLYRTLGNEALGIMAERAPLKVTSWSNAAGGDLTLTNAVCPKPTDLIQLFRVEYDGVDNDLELATVEWLDEREPGWREATGDPDKYTVKGKDVVLNSIPSNTTGKLVFRGTAYLPEFSEAAAAVNPLSFVPWRFQMLPREYIIARLPMTPARPSGDSPAAAQWAIAETQRRAGARAEALAAWQLGLAELPGQVNRARFRDFRY